MKSIVLVVVVLFGAAISGARAGSETITQDELVRRTQELLDAVVPGNQEPWKKYFADDCIYSDEKGRTLDKAALVADITAMPAGYSGKIKVVNPKSLIHGDTAVLAYDLDETETIFGQNLTARYHVTDTWMHRNGDWQIVASQTHRYYEDPAAGKTDPKTFPGYVGSYELAPGKTRTLSVEGDKLFDDRNGKKTELIPESGEIYFRKGVEGRILFRHDSAGKVDALIDRRNNEDVVWRKIK
jgi:hypothetical protein